MQKKWIIIDINNHRVFAGADVNGVFFCQPDVAIRFFDSEVEAIHRLQEEAEIFPGQFTDKICTIIPVYINI